MPRYFQNVSPFGDLVTLGRTVEKGDVLTAYDEGIAAGLAEQPLNWLEVADDKGTPMDAPEPQPQPEPVAPEPESTDEPAADIAPEPQPEPVADDQKSAKK